MLVAGLTLVACKQKNAADTAAPVVDATNIEQEWEHFMDEIERAPFELRGEKMISTASKNINNELGYRILTTIELEPSLRLRLLKEMPDSMQRRTEAAELIRKLQADGNGRINNFNMDTLGGDWIQLYSELKKNKITIIDFWASWCQPCRAEMPAMVKLYNDFKGKGLGIVGISLDTEHDAWEKAVKELGMTWTQMSDLKGWDNMAAKTCHVTAIPFTMVVDAEGNILEQGLRAEQLREYLGKTLK